MNRSVKTLFIRAIFPRFGEISITLRLLQHTVVSAVFQNRCFGKGQSKVRKTDGSQSKSESQQIHDASKDTTCKGANYLKLGDDPAFKLDSEYPEWLWKLADSPEDLSTMSPYDKTYWRRLRKKQAHERNLQQKQRGR